MHISSNTDSGLLVSGRVSICTILTSFSMASSPDQDLRLSVSMLAVPMSCELLDTMMRHSPPTMDTRTAQLWWLGRLTEKRPSSCSLTIHAAIWPLPRRISRQAFVAAASAAAKSRAAPDSTSSPGAVQPPSSAAPVPPVPSLLASLAAAAGGPHESSGGRPAASMTSTVRSTLAQAASPGSRAKVALRGHTAGETGTSTLSVGAWLRAMRKMGSA
mmetsp:Transcript_4028/g.10391  ORF Transcript_4028/g.10391 Transcript_4028/m.10391 type:complete len:216 (-) Transcript_4028:665-1312(-)